MLAASDSDEGKKSGLIEAKVGTQAGEQNRQEYPKDKETLVTNNT